MTPSAIASRRTCSSALLLAWAAAAGQLSGVARNTTPSVEVQFSGVNGALNAVGRNGVVHPIDANRFRRLSFRLRRSNGIPDVNDAVERGFNEPRRR